LCVLSCLHIMKKRLLIILSSTVYVPSKFKYYNAYIKNVVSTHLYHFRTILSFFTILTSPKAQLHIQIIHTIVIFSPSLHQQSRNCVFKYPHNRYIFHNNYINHPQNPYINKGAIMYSNYPHNPYIFHNPYINKGATTYSNNPHNHYIFQNHYINKGIITYKIICTIVIFSTILASTKAQLRI